MSKYYTVPRTRNIYDPKSDKPYKISRSKLDLFLNCARCFYLDRRLGVGQPPGFPFNLNSAVDSLLKKEFDEFRMQKKAHPLMIKAGIDAVPFDHVHMDVWRDSLRQGIQFHHRITNLIITGGVDDVWLHKSKELIIVDYKATSKAEAVSIDADWQIGYKRQMSLYGWLFKKNEFKVHRHGYFVYCNGKADVPRFEGRLNFEISVLPYELDDSWVETAVQEAHACLNKDEVPERGDDCDYCRYNEAVRLVIDKPGHQGSLF